MTSSKCMRWTASSGVRSQTYVIVQSAVVNSTVTSDASCFSSVPSNHRYSDVERPQEKRPKHEAPKVVLRYVQPGNARPSQEKRPAIVLMDHSLTSRSPVFATAKSKRATPAQSRSKQKEKGAIVKHRTPHACENCKMKKVKCDGNKKCTACKLTDSICMYTARRESDGDYAQRIREILEEALKKLYKACRERSDFPGTIPNENDQPISTTAILEGLGLIGPQVSPSRLPGVQSKARKFQNPSAQSRTSTPQQAGRSRDSNRSLSSKLGTALSGRRNLFSATTSSEAAVPDMVGTCYEQTRQRMGKLANQGICTAARLNQSPLLPADKTSMRYSPRQDSATVPHDSEFSKQSSFRSYYSPADLSHERTVETERSRQFNQERAFVAASRRTDRTLKGRLESARRASELHKQRTGRRLKITEKVVIDEEIYEEQLEANLSFFDSYWQYDHVSWLNTGMPNNHASSGPMDNIMDTVVDRTYAQRVPADLYPAYGFDHSGSVFQPDLLSSRLIDVRQQEYWHTLPRDYSFFAVHESTPAISPTSDQAYHPVGLSAEEYLASCRPTNTPGS